MAACHLLGFFVNYYYAGAVFLFVSCLAGTIDFPIGPEKIGNQTVVSSRDKVNWKTKPFLVGDGLRQKTYNSLV